MRFDRPSEDSLPEAERMRRAVERLKNTKNKSAERARKARASGPKRSHGGRR